MREIFAGYDLSRGGTLEINGEKYIITATFSGDHLGTPVRRVYLLHNGSVEINIHGDINTKYLEQNV